MILNVNIINFAFPPIINVKMNFINITLAHNMNGFTIISKLGDGAYSVVYKVKRVADGKIYALKKVKLTNLSSKEKQNALNEVRILASVKSTFVISYKEAFIDDKDQSLCIVMEYADKGDLYQKITQFKKMNTQFEEIDVWRIFIQMVRGLKSLHELKILHRDLKSANIFLFADGSAKLGDLNVSKVARKGLGYTQTGTPYYASPEVWNDSPYDNKSDIWSLGCVTYEMLALRPPFRAENMDGLYQKVTKGAYGRIPDKYSKDIGEVIKMMLKVNPNDRPTCAQILRHPYIVKRIEFFQASANFENIDINAMDEGELLKTIRIPNNILFLTDKLPQANYDSHLTERNKTKPKQNNFSFPSGSLPNIKIAKSSDTKSNATEAQNKTKDSLPSLAKQNVPTSRNRQLLNQKKKHIKDLDLYINSVADKYKIYVPHYSHSSNNRNNAQSKKTEELYNLYMPKKNQYKVIPNKKLIPLRNKK